MHSDHKLQQNSLLGLLSPWIF